jgi:PAS domain S-box-containing protein
MTGHYSITLVLLSYAVAVFASFTSLDLAGRALKTSGRAARAWLTAAAVAMGGGIWSMHFIGMLAWIMPMPVAYDIGITAASLVLPVAVTGIGFFLVRSNSASRFRLPIAGVLMGTGIVSMHYLGMVGMRMQAVITYDAELLVTSIVIAILASAAALWLAFRTDRGWQKIAAAFVMGLAVAGMHYTGMAAAVFHIDEQLAAPSDGGLGSTALAALVAAISFTLLLMAMLSVTVDRRLARREADTLRRSELRFRALVQNASDALLLTDRTGTITYASGSLEQVFGRPEAVLLGRCLAVFLPGAADAASDLIASALDHRRESITRTLRLELADGSWRTLEVIATNLLDHPDVTGIVLTVRDVTERLRLEQELDQASRLATLGTLAAGVAHEMSQPLNAISLWSQDALLSLEEGQTDPEHIKQVLTVAVEQAQRLRHIIDHMRIFSRRDIGGVETFDARDSIRAATRLLDRELAAAGISLSVSLPDVPAFARGRPLHLEQVILNLLSNARDAIRDQEERVPGTTARIDVAMLIASGDETFSIMVCDTGTGIDPQAFAHIFDPFFTTKEVGKGTGLGLAVSYRIIEAMGGRLSATNIVREGAVMGAQFKVCLPWVEASTATRQAS